MWLLFFLFGQSVSSSLLLTALQCEYLTNPLGIEEAAPRFSWQVVFAIPEPVPTPRGKAQASFQIQVYNFNNETVWDSGFVNSSLPFTYYGGVPLTAGSTYYWTVRIVDESRLLSPWAHPFGSFTVGLKSSWSATLIGMASANKTACPWFRRSFNVPASAFPLNPLSVLAYIGSVGYHEGYLNGIPVSTSVLNPSISYLPRRVLYRVYDVTPLLRPGKNCFAIWIGGGWSLSPILNPQGSTPLVIAELRGPLSATSPPEVLVKTDNSWSCSLSTTSHVGNWEFQDYGGDHIDDRLYVEGWNSVNFDDSKWEKATEYSALQRQLTPDIIEPTVRESSVMAVSMNVTMSGFLYSMEEVFTGWIEIGGLSGKEGDLVTISVSTHSSVASEFNMIDTYIFNSSGKGQFSQKFSYHEILYVLVTGLKTQPPRLEDVVGYRLTGNWTQTGHVNSSSDLLNRIYTTTVNNYRGLVLGGYSVDCPHRERLGYGGDAHTSFEFALSRYGAGAFFSKWSQDWIDVQGTNGFVPYTAPTVSGGGGPAWSGFVVTMPWEVYVNYGDVQILRKMYPTMLQLLSFLRSKMQSDGLLHAYSDSQWDFLGDWITPHGSESNPKSLENILFNNCYFHYITLLTANVSLVLGNEVIALALQKEAESLSLAINNAFFKPSGIYIDNLQTHLVMPLATYSVPDTSRDLVMKNLETTITVLNKGHLDTGLTGTYFLIKYLIRSYRNDLIFLMTNQTTFPSYGWFLEQGYTSWPESWDATDKPSTSILHGCYNSIGMWFMQGLLGIQLLPPVVAGKGPMVKIRSGFDSGVQWAVGSLNTIYGNVTSSWSLLSSSALQHNISVPVNCVVVLELPGTDVDHVTESGIPVSKAVGVTYLGGEEQHNIHILRFQIVSGTFRFFSMW